MPQASPNHAASYAARSSNRQSFHKPHTAIGATGHWVREAGILAPLVIGEFVKDADKR